MFMLGKGAECFAQRGCIVRCLPGGGLQKTVLPIPPKPLGDKSADAMLKALELKNVLTPLIDGLEQAGRLRCADSPVAAYFVVVLSLTVDAACANLVVVRKVPAKYSDFNAKTC